MVSMGLLESRVLLSSTAALLKDLNVASPSTDPGILVPYNGAGFFIAHASTSGAELYRTDGTAAGTALVKRIATNSLGISLGTYDRPITTAAGLMFFSMSDGTLSSPAYL